MKFNCKHLSTLLASLVLAMLLHSAGAYDFMESGIAYNINSDGRTLTVTYTDYCSDNNYSGLKLADIPPTVTHTDKHYSVTAIGDYAFYNCKGLTSVIIPEEVTTIGKDAFAYCSSIHDLTFNAKNAKFSGVSPFKLASVENLYIGNDVQSLPDSIMRDNHSLRSVTIGESLTWPGIAPFMGCINLKTVIFNARNCNNTTEDIAEYNSAFYQQYQTMRNIIFNDSVETLTFGEKVETLPDYLISSSKLKDLIISDNISKVENYTFTCYYLESIYIGKSLTSITGIPLPGTLQEFSIHPDNPNFVYQDRVLYDKDVTTILCYMPFKDDEEYDLPSTITYIPYSWFWGGSIPYLKVLNLHARVKRIDYYENEIPGFTIRDSGLEAINVDPANPYYASIDGVLFNHDKTLLMVYPAGRPDETYVCPNGVKIIGPYASRYNRHLRTLVLSDDVELLSEFCFSNAKELESVTVNKCQLISRSAFSNAKNLKNVVFGTGLKIISRGVFQNCTGLTSISLPEGLNYIGANAFSGCTNLFNVKLPSTLLSINREAFYNCSFTSINIPDGLIQMGYSVLPNSWLNVQTPEADGFVYAGKFAYRYMGSSNVVSIKDGTVGLAGGALTSQSVSQIYFPESLESIASARDLKQTNWYKNQTPVNDIIYAGNVALARKTTGHLDEIVFKEGTKGIAGQAYLGYAQTIHIPGTVTNIGERALDAVIDIDTLIIDEGVKVIGYNGIDEIYSLKFLSLPSSLQAYDAGNLIPGTGYKTQDYKLQVAFTTPPLVDKSMFFCAGWGHQDPRTHGTLIVPVGTKASYKQAHEWNEFYRIMEQGESAVIGDVNGDGRVNVSDVSTLVNMILGLVEKDETAADVNGDGRVNVSDVAALINIILGIH